VKPPLVLIANARMPSQRAQSLQVAQVAAAFARAGAPTTLLHARRFPTPELPTGEDLFDYYAVAPVEPRPVVEAVPCFDWIDRVPTRWQYLPARLQELTFARNAALRVAALGGEARVLSREAESAHALLRGKRPHERVFLEVHRVPGGASRRRWLLEASRGARGLLAISGGVAEDLLELGVEAAKLRVEHDGFEAGRGAPPDRAAARRELGLDADVPVVVYTGGLLAWKGVELLVEAARSLPRFQFVIVGGMDADVARLRELASGLDHVRLDGFQPPTRVATYLAAADLGVIPNRSTPAISARYTSPLKAFEAMAVGLPLVVSDLSSLRELFTDGSDARFVAPDDAGALAAGIEELMGDAEQRSRFRTRLLERAPEHSWDARAERILTWMDKREECAA
jgi:glycosyltransferase involved in cell wall biosynthesis